MAVSTVGCVSWVLFKDFSKIILPIILTPPVSSVIFTILFLHLDKLCCCNPRDLLSVYDPDLDKRFIMVDDELVEDPEDDRETGEQQTEHVMGSACNGELTEMTNMIWSEGRVVQKEF